MSGSASPPAGVHRRWVAFAAYVVATFLAFPTLVAGRVVDLGLVCAWLAPAALLLAVDGLAPGRAVRRGFLAGLLAHTAVLHWIYVVTVSYGHAPPLVGVLAPAGLAAYIALFPAAFAATAAALAARGLAGPFALAAVWTVLDHARSFFLTGFPWATLGYAQHANPALLGLAPYTGVYGLSFATVLGSVALADGFRALRRRERPPGRALAALAVVAGLHGVGGLSAWADAGDPAAAPRVRVAVIQGNIDQGVKWSPAWAERTLETYEDLSRQAAARGAEWIAWPETAVPGSPSVDPELRHRLAALADETGAVLVVGAVGIEPARGIRDARFYDSGFAVVPGNGIAARYDKAHLVPFGEYLPLRDVLGHWLAAVATGIAPRDVSAGDGPRALELPVRASGAVLPVGVPICYELLFPDLVRRFVREGAGLLLAITNDAWYGRTGAPYQFLAITALRSAENRVWTARAANTGVSAFIDHRGRVREQTPIFERKLLVADVPLRLPGAGGSFYTRHGDVFAWACWIGTAALAWKARRTSTRGSEG